jgi:hypothetical protein
VEQLRVGDQGDELETKEDDSNADQTAVVPHHRVWNPLMIKVNPPARDWRAQGGRIGWYTPGPGQLND